MTRHSDTRGLTLASVIMMASVLGSRGLGVVREVILARLLGTGPEMDAYVAAFLLPELVNHLLAGGFISITFIPIFQRHLQEGHPERAWGVFSNLFTCGTIILTLCIVGAMFATPALLQVMGHSVKQSPEQLQLTTHLTRIILPAQLCIYWGALLMAVQMAQKKFLLPALSPLFYNAGIIAGGVLLFKTHGVAGFSWGVTLGAFLGNVVIQLPGAIHAKMRLRPRVDLRDPDLKQYIVKTLPLVLGAGMTFSNEVFFRFFGSFLDSGSLATINYSLRAMLVLVGVFGQALGISSFPYLSSLVVEGRLDEMNRMAHRVLTRVIALLIPFSAVMSVLAPQVVDILFRMGRFDQSAAEATVSALRLYLIGAFTGAATAIIIRCFYARQDTMQPMIISTATSVGAIPLYLIFGRTMGASGIALAGSLFMVIQCSALYLFWYRSVPSPAYAKRLALDLCKTLGASAAAAALCLGLRAPTDRLLSAFDLHFKVRAVVSAVLIATPALALAFVVIDRLKVLPLAGLLRKKGVPETVGAGLKPAPTKSL